MTFSDSDRWVWTFGIPMDMHENFFIRDIAWHIGGFTFDKVGNNVAVTAMVR
jgi:hypothetical protein